RTRADGTAPGAKVSASTPTITTRRGSDPSTSPNASASATLQPCVDGVVVPRKACAERKQRTVPGAPSGAVASTTTSRSYPWKASSSARPSPRSDLTSTPGRSAPSHRARSARTTCAPMASSPRSSLPIPTTRVAGGIMRPSPLLHLQPQEVRGARDARVVVADRLFAQVLEPVVGNVEMGLDHAAQVLLDAALALRRGRNDGRVEDDAVVVEGVAVVEGAAR